MSISYLQGQFHMNAGLENLIAFYVTIEMHVKIVEAFVYMFFKFILIVQVKLIWGNNY